MMKRKHGIKKYKHAFQNSIESSDSESTCGQHCKGYI